MIFFLKTGIDTIREIRFQRKYIAETLVPYMAELEQKYNGTFPAYQRQKIEGYYSLLVPVILSLNYRKLYGQPFTATDRWSASLIGLITPVFDDMFDVENYDLKILERMMLDPYTGEVDTFSANVAMEVQRSLLATAAEPAAFLAQCKAMFDAQVDTLKLFDPGISKEDLERMPYVKGSTSFILYHVHLLGNPSPAMAEVLHDVGGLQQICNDLFDVYKDIQEGNFTVANTCKNFTAFRHFFIEKIRLQSQKIRALPYPTKNKRRFSLIMQLMEALGLVAIDHFIELEKQYGKGLDWAKLSRKEMVLDMVAPGNQLKWVYTLWKISRM